MSTLPIALVRYGGEVEFVTMDVSNWTANSGDVDMDWHLGDFEVGDSGLFVTETPNSPKFNFTQLSTVFLLFELRNLGAPLIIRFVSTK